MPAIGPTCRIEVELDVSLPLELPRHFSSLAQRSDMSLDDRACLSGFRTLETGVAGWARSKCASRLSHADITALGSQSVAILRSPPMLAVAASPRSLRGIEPRQRSRSVWTARNAARALSRLVLRDARKGERPPPPPRRLRGPQIGERVWAARRELLPPHAAGFGHRASYLSPRISAVACARGG